MSVPIITPNKTKTYHVKQSKYDVVPKLPFKSIIYAPSNSGKTVLITNLIENVYRDCFERIYIISPVWWFRLTPRMEVFFDEVLTPGFAYKFVNITKTYAYPKPFLKDKIVRTYITHGAPSIPS